MAITLLEALTQAKHSVKVLDISDNDLGDDGAVELNDFLVSNHSLTSIDVSNNEFTYHGFSLLNNVLVLSSIMISVTDLKLMQ